MLGSWWIVQKVRYWYGTSYKKYRLKLRSHTKVLGYLWLSVIVGWMEIFGSIEGVKEIRYFDICGAER